MKKVVLLSMLLASHCLNGEVKKTEVYTKLVGREIQGLDGIPNALDGIAISQIIIVRSKIKDIIFGELNKTTLLREGKYNYNGKKCGMDDLVKFEEELKQNPNALKTRELNKSLEIAKKDFIDTTLEFMQRVAWIKSLVVGLLKQSLDSRKIKKSLCYAWIDTPVGKENEVFTSKVKNLKEFTEFLNHVNNFLGDLINSCPKAFNQFKEKFKNKL